MDLKAHDSAPVESFKDKFHINKNLIPIKVLLYLFYGGVSSLYPYITIHMKSLGITLTQTGIVYAILPLTTFCAGPLAGALADKTGRYKLIFIIFLLLTIFAHTLMTVAVPAHTVAVTKTSESLNDMTMQAPCNLSRSSVDSQDTPELRPSGNPKVTKSCNTSEAEKYDFLITKCTSSCKGDVLPGLCLYSTENVVKCPTPDEILAFPLRLTNVTLTYHATAAKIRSPVDPFWNVVSYSHGGFPMTKISCYPYLNINESVCGITCAVSTNISADCYQETETGNIYVTFGLYLIFRIFSGIVINVCFLLVDSSMLALTNDYKGDIGVNRAFTLLGFCSLPPISGVLVDYYSRGGDVNFAPAFYLFNGMLLLSAVTISFSKVNARLSAEDIWKNVGKILLMPRVAAFVFVVFFIGLSWGFLESFLFWFLDNDLQAPKWLLGFTNTVAGLSGIPVVALSTSIIRYTGHTKIFIFSGVVYGVRYLGYSMVYNVYLILPLEALEAFSNSLLWATASIYAAKLAPEYLATLQGVISGVHYGLGRGGGSLIGGVLINNLGTRLAFQVFSGVCFGYSLIYAVAHYSYLRYQPKTYTASSTSGKSKGGQTVKLDEAEKLTDEESQRIQEIAMLSSTNARAFARGGSLVESNWRDSAYTKDSASLEQHDPEKVELFEMKA